MNEFNYTISIANKLRYKYINKNNSLKEIIKNICINYNIYIVYSNHFKNTKIIKNKWIITLPKYTSQNYDNFIIAHEFGYIFLNKNKNMLNFEKQLNLFASEFLMPKNEFIKMSNFFNKNVDKLSKYFEVSKSSILIRLAVLKL